MTETNNDEASTNYREKRQERQEEKEKGQRGIDVHRSG